MEKDIHYAASGLWRLIHRKKNNHPELFSELERNLIDHYHQIIKDQAPPFNPKDVLRRS